MKIPVTFQGSSDPCIPGTWNAILAKLSAWVDVDGVTGIIVGAAPPHPDDRDKAWLRVSAQSVEMNGVYVYNPSARGVGGWVKDVPAPVNEIRIWTGTLQELKFHDGGDDGALGDYSGPMWCEAEEFRFRIPIGVGTNSVAYDGLPATTINVGAQGGQERVALTAQEGVDPAHTHTFGRQESESGGERWNDVWLRTGMNAGTGQGLYVNGVGSGYPFEPIENQAGAWLVTDRANMSAGETVKSHDNMPPYRGVYFIKRTSRKGHYVAG